MSDHEQRIAQAFEKLEKLIQRNQELRDTLVELVNPEGLGHQVGSEARRVITRALVKDKGGIS